MSIFANIAAAIFGPAHGTAAPAARASTAAPSASPTGGSTPVSSAAPPPAAAAASDTQRMSQGDVEALIAKLPGAHAGEHDWKHSIVDLMKLLKLDSSLAARKQLAQELGYTGPLDGSAQMNEWLHKQVMVQLASHGGRLSQGAKRVS